MCHNACTSLGSRSCRSKRPSLPSPTSWQVRRTTTAPLQPVPPHHHYTVNDSYIFTTTTLWTTPRTRTTHTTALQPHYRATTALPPQYHRTANDLPCTHIPCKQNHHYTSNDRLPRNVCTYSAGWIKAKGYDGLYLDEYFSPDLFDSLFFKSPGFYTNLTLGE